MKNNKKWDIETIERIFAVVSGAFIIWTLLVGYFFQDNIGLILFTIFSWGILIFVGLGIIVWSIYESLKKEPFTLFSAFLAVLFISIPLIIIISGNQNQLSDSVKNFYTIAVGIGINYVIDSVFKFTENDFLSEQKKILTKKAAFTKIFFNVIYISGYSSLFVVDYIRISIFSSWPYWIRFISLTLSLLVTTLTIVLSLSKAIKKEILNEEPDYKTKVKQILTFEIEQVSQLYDTLKKDDTITKLEEIKKNLDDRLKKLE